MIVEHDCSTIIWNPTHIYFIDLKEISTVGLHNHNTYLTFTYFPRYGFFYINPVRPVR